MTLWMVRVRVLTGGRVKGVRKGRVLMIPRMGRGVNICVRVILIIRNCKLKFYAYLIGLT